MAEGWVGQVPERQRERGGGNGRRGDRHGRAVREKPAGGVGAPRREMPGRAANG
ncbi:MAG TPA: hypothetical protein VFI65_31805 [Streptosporangiaceae bacterium]|nr:hypothetical protein [Streptosporangiaceae bacterium]